MSDPLLLSRPGCTPLDLNRLPEPRASSLKPSPRRAAANSSGPSAATPYARQGGFTLVEIMVVVLVLVGLMGIGFPAYQSMLASQRRSSAQSLVDAVAAAIAAHGRNHIAVGDASGRSVSRQLWDFDGDGIVDGDPARDPGFSVADRDAARSAGYRGVVATTGLSLPSGARDPQTDRVLDPWGEPLRIAFDAEAYAPLGLRVTSDGPDREPGTADDIHSGKDRP